VFRHRAALAGALGVIVDRAEQGMHGLRGIWLRSVLVALGLIVLLVAAELVPAPMPTRSGGAASMAGIGAAGPGE
jgi:hypothetical protein